MRKAGSMFRQEDVGDDLRLLFQAIAVEGFFRLDLVRITAERVAHERQVEAASRLGLPHMCHLVNEEALAAERLSREIVRPDSSIGMEVDVASRCHGRIAGVEGPPFALEQAHLRIIDRIAEYGTRKRNLA